MTAALSRPALARAALELVQEEGLDALTMRTLAARIGVKAASLYWHVRDRDELLDLVADALLERVPARSEGRDWRGAVLGLCAAAAAAAAAQRDGDRILLAVPGAVRRSGVYTRVVGALAAAGVEEGLAREVAAMMLGFVTTQPSSRFEAPPPPRGKTLTLAVDSGSRGVVARAGGAMETLFRVPPGPTAAPPATVRKDRVIVRRLRGGKHGELELNPAHPWRVQVQGPTWNTRLDLRGLDLRGLQLDSGASNVECLLPRPHGPVPLNVSSGVLRATFRRPPDVAVLATLSAGAVRVELDDYRPRVVVSDTSWTTPGATESADRYELRVASGAVRITLDATGPDDLAAAPEGPPPARADAVLAALAAVVDGLAAGAR